MHVKHEAPAGVGLTPGQAAAQILVVDDERIVRAFAARVLREAGYRVREARDGSEAWELASREGAELDAVLGSLAPDTTIDDVLSHGNPAPRHLATLVAAA